MRSIAIINQKGGVGKTTTAVNVAAALARSGQRVLLLDMDPQCHASLHLGVEARDPDTSMYDVLVHGAPIADVARSVAENLVLVPSHLDLVGTELELADRERRDTLLPRALQTYQQGFDFCLVDCAPSLGLLTINALAAVSEVIIPLQPHFLALQGLGRLLETVVLVRGVLNPELRVAGIALCMFERGTRLAQEVLADVTVFVGNARPEDAWYGARIYTTAIRRNIKLAECPSFGQTIFDYAPSSHGAEDYRALAAEILATPEPLIVTEDEAAPAELKRVDRPAAEVLPAEEAAAPARALAPGASAEDAQAVRAAVPGDGDATASSEPDSGE
jgi:chromosome partitioning protein